MTGALLALGAGVGFGFFQALNRRALGGMTDPYVSTFFQLVVALAVLLVATAATEDLGLLASASALSILYFVLAGVVHFSVGWTLLNMSQLRIGAARTSPLLSTNPLWGAAIAAAALQEFPALLAWAGIALVTGGALVVSLERAAEAGWGIGWRDSVFGIGTAVSWAISPIFVREALEGLPSPLLGLTLGMVAAVLVYGAALPFRARREGATAMTLDAALFKLVAGFLLGFSVWARWAALDFSAVAIVLALGLVSVPVVLVLSPVLMGRHVERVDAQVWLGAALVVAGSLLLVLRS